MLPFNDDIADNVLKMIKSDVSKVLKSGRFYDAGFRPDDLILDLNGTRCAAITGRSTARSFRCGH